MKSFGFKHVMLKIEGRPPVVLQRGIAVVGYNVQASVNAKNKLITHFDTGSVNDTNALATVAIATNFNLNVQQANPTVAILTGVNLHHW